MSLVNWREAVERFSHIDATFVSCDLDLPKGSVTYSVRLYPWWEHPLYRTAVEQGENWGFGDLPDEANITITVFAREVQQVKLTRRPDVIDWCFLLEHPLLWPYEDEEQIFINAPISIDRWMELIRATSSRIGYRTNNFNVAQYFDPSRMYEIGLMPPFSSGKLPRPLFLIFRQLLAALLQIPFAVGCDQTFTSFDQ